ncbi:MAG: DUF2935 domain-containing protein [Clostridiales bacterium]|nr:DUF2935 domain-containing protein [Clostridiales bacterium]
MKRGVAAMLSDVAFVKESLHIHLFFLRVMKEHIILIQAALPAKNHDLLQRATALRERFERLLMDAVSISCGIVGAQSDAVTEYTYEAERATSFLTGIPVNLNVTQAELYLGSPSGYPAVTPALIGRVLELNTSAIAAVRDLIGFKTLLLENVASCRLFTTGYPLLIEHDRREAQLYADILQKLQRRASPDEAIGDAIEKEAFWNQIMAEHAKFILGMLDPIEGALIHMAGDFAEEFDALTRRAMELACAPADLPGVTQDSKEATIELRDFKTRATKGLLDCDIRSVIVPLLADHVLREANHYLILLGQFGQTLQ